MANYLIKRLMWSLPSLWLIATLVFLLSRLLPGAFGSESILRESGSFYNTARAEAREAAYRSFLRKTGQHLPLFYFSIRPAAEPDMQFLLLPEQERLFLKKLSWTFGDGASAMAYHKSIKELEQKLALSDEMQHQELFVKLYKSSEPETILATAQEIKSKVNNNSASKLYEAAIALTQQPQPNSFLIPAMHWHGTQNQYHQWLVKLLQGNLGISFRDNRSVTVILKEAIATTFLMLLTSMVLSIILALETSIFLLKRIGSQWRRILLPFLFFTDRIPVFLLALLFLTLFANPDYLQLFPAYGLGYYSDPGAHWLQHFIDKASYLVLPVICLVTVNLPYLTSQFYNALADVSQTDYVKTAKAKGLAEGAVIRKHILRNALLPIITLLSDFLPALVAGAVIIETIFAIPGVGSLLIESVQARDYPVVVGIVTVVALVKILSHLLADLLYSFADPRIRLASS